MIRENIKKMEEYKPPLEGRAKKNYLLLDFNEMTTEPSPQIKRALKKFIDSGKLQAYPEYGNLNKKIADYAGVKVSEVIPTNGSDQAIDIVFRAVLAPKDKVIIPTPSFAMFYQSAKIQGACILKPFYNRKDLSFPLKEVLDLINRKVKLIVICNPNNPTGSFISVNKVEKILKKAKRKGATVLHDEAYFEFSKITAKDLIAKYDNLFITRTFSKAFGLASLRCGYVISQKDNIKQLLKIRGPYDVNMCAKTAVLAALGNIKYMTSYVKRIMEKSKPKLEEFLTKKKITFFPSKANFLLIKVSQPEKVYKFLKKKGILVRPRNDPVIKNTIRISIGTVRETERFIKIFRTIPENYLF